MDKKKFKVSYDEKDLKTGKTTSKTDVIEARNSFIAESKCYKEHGGSARITITKVEDMATKDVTTETPKTEEKQEVKADEE